MEKFRLERTPGSHPVLLLLRADLITNSDQVADSLPHWLMKICRDEGSSLFLGGLFWHWPALTMKNFFLLSGQSSCDLCLMSFCWALLRKVWLCLLLKTEGAFPTGNERLLCSSRCLSICKINKPSSPDLFSYFVSRQKLENMMFVRYVSRSFITEKKNKKMRLMRTLQSEIYMKFKYKNRTVYKTDLSLRILYKQNNVLIIKETLKYTKTWPYSKFTQYVYNSLMLTETMQQGMWKDLADEISIFLCCKHKINLDLGVHLKHNSYFIYCDSPFP